MNTIKRYKLFSALVIIILHAVLWQYGEGWIISMGEKYSALLTGKPLNQIQLFDYDGIPVQSYRAYGIQYNPLFIAVQAKKDFDNEPRNIKRFLKLSDWLVDNAEIGDSTLWLPYRFDLPGYNLKAPWQSGLAQSVVLTVFVRRHQIEPGGKWMELAAKALNTIKPESHLVLKMEDGGLWFMEYPSSVDPYVLNGMMSVLLELDFYYKQSGNIEAKELFDRGFESLVSNLDKFDYHGFSYYGIRKQKAGRNYHQKHIRQLLELAAVKPHPKLEYYQKRWQSRDQYPVLVQLVFNPRPRRIMVFWISLLLPLLIMWLGFSVKPKASLRIVPFTLAL
ncbi:MAG: D-glucuronyl C5-epimerase family protein [Candidatus Cloacimonadaceae bacterium]|nr:D-glucuronyl C5-epimerase family protein [Candidatus Cloacimonadaceae bacterium]MDP3115375.1 D-glucuronyl C5-epimerase family protein [Candidatus Cloacimonadaceae bacterium]